MRHCWGWEVNPSEGRCHGRTGLCLGLWNCGSGCILFIGHIMNRDRGNRHWNILGSTEAGDLNEGYSSKEKFGAEGYEVRS